MYSSILSSYYTNTTSIPKPNEAEEPIIQIDSGLRKITIPKSVQTIGVTLDNLAERLFFQIPRYYDGHDLSTEDIVIRFNNAKGEYGTYEVTDIDISEKTILFMWEISNLVTAYPGVVKFSVRFGANPSYQYQTQAANLTVLETLSVDDETAKAIGTTIIDEIEIKIATLQTELALANSEILSLKERVSYLEENVVYALED